MCTAVSYKTRDFYFGRTLDYECSYGEQVTITPRNYPFYFREMGLVDRHYAIIGMAHVAECPWADAGAAHDRRGKNYPLYYDGVNEKGLAMAGLNFVGNACYSQAAGGRENIAVFELIPWILGSCATVSECREKLERLNLVDIPFSGSYPTARLHWIIADKEEAITLESVAEGLKVYDNPVGVLANNPTFPEQMFNLNNYMHLSPRPPQNNFAQELKLTVYSRGMGALGLPGDVSSQSRFVRAAFVKMNSVSGDSEEESVGQFFHILGSVEQQMGCCQLEGGDYDRTIYTSCCNAAKGIYYYTTYGNRQITGVDMRRVDVDGTELVCYPLAEQEQIRMEN